MDPQQVDEVDLREYVADRFERELTGQSDGPDQAANV
jgi:hypothetical protein